MPGRPSRRSARRRSDEPVRVAARPAVMPGTRAVVGALLCVLAALLTIAAYARANRAPTTTYVVAAGDLEPGAAIERNDVQLVTMHLPAPLRARAVDRIDDLIGATLLGPVAKGELVQIGNVIKKAGGPSSQEFSFPISSAFAAAGRLRGGERVDVIATFGTGEAADAQIVDRPASGLGASGDTLVVTLAVTPDVDAVRLARAVAVGKVMLVRTTGVERGGAAAPTSTEVGP